MSEPRTPAGRALYSGAFWHWDALTKEGIADAILAIETEAAAMARPSRADLEGMTTAELTAYVQERSVAALDRLGQREAAAPAPHDFATQYVAGEDSRRTERMLGFEPAAPGLREAAARSPSALRAAERFAAHLETLTRLTEEEREFLDGWRGKR